MPPLLQHFVVDGRYLGSRPLPRCGAPVPSTVLFCPVCGEIWARIVSDGSSIWQFRLHRCRKHPDFTLTIPDGGLLSDSPWSACPFFQFSDDWPPPAIQFEFESLLALYPKEPSA